MQETEGDPAAIWSLEAAGLVKPDTALDVARDHARSRLRPLCRHPPGGASCGALTRASVDEGPPEPSPARHLRTKGSTTGTRESDGVIAIFGVLSGSHEGIAVPGRHHEGLPPMHHRRGTQTARRSLLESSVIRRRPVPSMLTT